MQGLDAFDVRPAPASGGDTDAAVVLAADGRRWVVRAPRTATAGAALEAEVVLLRALAAHVESGALPFAVPVPAGFAPLPEGGRAMVHPLLRGRPLPLEQLGPGPGLAAEVGRGIARIHELPVEVVEDAGLPTYDAGAYRERRLAEVDEAARTGRVPGGLLRRWEHALEDVAMWRFQPTVTHGDLTTDHVLCVRDEVTAVLGWSEAKVADPADDLAWLLVAAPHEAVDPILESYAMHRTEMRDPHLADRALLAGELALARWLLHGVRNDDAEVVDDATAMLVELDEQTAEDDVAPAAPGWEAPAPADDDGVETADGDVAADDDASSSADDDEVSASVHDDVATTEDDAPRSPDDDVPASPGEGVGPVDDAGPPVAVAVAVAAADDDGDDDDSDDGDEDDDEDPSNRT